MKRREDVGERARDVDVEARRRMSKPGERDGGKKKKDHKGITPPITVEPSTRQRTESKEKE